MKFLLFGRVHFHSLLAVALFAPISLAIGQTDAPGSAASGDDLAKRLEWLRAQVGKSADPKAAPNPANKKHFSDSRTLGLRPAEPHPSETDTPKSTPAPALKSIAQGPAATPSPSKTQAPEPTPKKSRIADRTASDTPSPASPSPKTASKEARTKVAKASPSPSPAAAQKRVAQAPSTTPSPAKTQAPESTSKKSRIADRSTSATPAPSPQPKTGSAEPRTKIAKASPSPSPVPAQKSIAKATPVPTTPAPRVAAKPTATPARRSEAVSLDTRFTDLRTTSSTHSLTSKPLSPITSITSSVPMTGSSTFPTSNSVSSRYPWKAGIVTTVFWIGEPVSGRNYTPNVASSWDPIWTRNYGGYDNPKPEARRNFIPANFIPRQNPFYVALPYNDVTRGTTKPEARVVIPWFREAYRREGQSVCRDRWVAVRNRSGRVAYAQWSDCGPFRTDHWQYVFGMERPKPNLNQGAGLDVSPAMRDYLGLQSTDVTDWKFVEAKDVPSGPWALYGDNNTCTQRGRFVRGGQAMPEVAARGR